jgi:hypothetical protein
VAGDSGVTLSGGGGGGAEHVRSVERSFGAAAAEERYFVVPRRSAAMGMWGYLHRVPADRLAELLANPNAIEPDLYPDDDVKRFPEHTVEKTWNAIEFILDRLAESGRIPRINPLTEGGKTGASFHYGDCWYRTPAEVAQIAETLGALSKEEFRMGYKPELMAEYNVYPGIWDREEEKEENFEYVWQWYQGLVNFYREAAAKGEGMLLHLG